MGFSNPIHRPRHAHHFLPINRRVLNGSVRHGSSQTERCKFGMDWQLKCGIDSMIEADDAQLSGQTRRNGGGAWGGETGPALFNGTGAIADDALPRFDSRLDGILGWGTSQHHCHISTGFSDPDGTRQKRNRRHHLSPTQQQQQQQQQRPGIFPLRVSMQMRLVPTHDGRGESNHNHGRFPPTTHTEKKKDE